MFRSSVFRLGRLGSTTAPPRALLSSSLVRIPRSAPKLSLRFISTPTLGPSAGTKITNPVRAKDGSVLQVLVSQNAAKKLNDIKVQDANSDLILRVGVESGGCHGFQYIFSLKGSDDIDKANDSIFERDGARVVIDESSLNILRDSTVDYTTELIGSQFKVVDSPYASSSCGCGSSFAFDFSAVDK